MKTIEIITAQNVVLEYELADFRDRVLAFIIDVSLLSVGLSVMAIFAGAFSDEAQTLYFALMYAVFIFYSLVMETLNKGRSVGKMALRIQVIKTSGGQARLAEYAGRWAFRMVDIYLSLGGIASVLIASSAKAQRIGDIVANTAVVKVRSNTNMNLEDLLKLHTQSAYVPRYPSVRQLPEADMLLIKSTIDRQVKFKNDAHDEALELLSKRVQSVLGVQNLEIDDRKFLQTILKDYVVLTR